MSKLLKCVVVSVFAVSLALSGCGGGGGGGATPEKMAEKYLKAALNSDYGTMKNLSSEKNKAAVEKEQSESKEREKNMPPEKKELLKKMQAMTPKADEAKISEDGNSASVKVYLVDSKGEKDKMSFKYDLVKENGAWKIDKQGK
jgi:ABC-type transporter MlaC component